jgi:uncharacterized protein (TIGR00297 family)
MPRIGRGIYRDAAEKRDVGIVAYPAMVLVLILLFRYQLEAAAALWAMMAFGDPAATIAGKLFGGPVLPWNRKKRWAGLLAYASVGGVTAVAAWLWVAARSPEFSLGFGTLLTLLLPVTVLGAFLESLDSGIDDNWIPPIPCALLLAFWFVAMPSSVAWSEVPAPHWAPALVVNGAIALIMGFLGVVTVSGAVAGGAVGAIVLAFGGWPHYAVLWGFFLLGTLATRLGFGKKQERGTEQEGRGRRGVRHVVANCGIAALLCILSYVVLGRDPRLSLAYVAAFSAALADTLGTEVGSLYGRRPISLLSLRPVAPGSRGAVSLSGVAAGLIGASAVGLLAAIVGLIPWGYVWIASAAGLAGSIGESLLSDLGRVRGFRVDHEFANAFNTFVGAVAALALWGWLRQGFLSVPFDWRGF